MNDKQFKKEMEELANDRTRSGMPDYRNKLWERYRQWCRDTNTNPGIRDFEIWKQDNDIESEDT